MLSWEKLLNPIRRADLHKRDRASLNTAVGRTQIERDYDRVLFAAPVRRLADKTQVFPMEQHDSVRTRLTHSHEVSNLARSIGVRLAFEHAEAVFGEAHESLQVKRNVPAMLAAVGLAHDLGNPPFGHQGEIAMQQWFAGKGGVGDVDEDFLQFDGNAQTFRLLTRLQILNDRFGLNLTVATLAALIKYPSIYGANDKGGFKKFGIFKSEKSIIEEVWEQTGLSHGVRHPLAYVMEACDDIAYSVIDAEDTVKKGYASFYDLIDHLESETASDDVTNEVVLACKGKNAEFRKEPLSSRELNDISMQIFRAKSISVMINCVSAVFVENIKKMLEGSIEPGFELIKNSRCAIFCKAVKAFDYRYGFQHKDVLRLELLGSNSIKKMMDMLWAAVSKEGSQDFPFERYVYGGISENYRRIYLGSEKLRYNKHQLICDAISGMTESYLMKKCRDYDELR